MRVSDADQAYMKRLGEWKAQSHATALAEHLALPVEERLARSWALYEAHRDNANLAAREDDPSPFYELAKKLGMYEP